MREYAPVCLAMLMAGGSFAAVGSPALAQSHDILPDGTLGAESSAVRTVAPQLDLIEGGATRGEYLFHSFEEFNIGEGWRADFANPDGIFNILSRVTGQNPSHLFGTLGVLGEADLFFLNPNGVMFGPDASLDIPGSLTISTGDGFVLPDGSVFSATNPEAPPLLTVEVEVPIEVRFDSELAAALSNEAVLEVGEDLTLLAGEVSSAGVLFAPQGDVLVEGVSGDVQVQDLAAQSAVLSADGNLILEESRLQTAGDLSLLARDTVWVRDSEENPFWAVAGGDLLVRGDEQVDILALNHLDAGFTSGGNLILRSENAVGGDAFFSTNGSFRIEQLQGELGNLFSPHDPIIRANGDVELANYSGGSLQILAGGSITIPGRVEINNSNEGADFSADFLLSDNKTPVIFDANDQPVLDLRAGVDWNQLGGPPGNTDGNVFPQPIFKLDEEGNDVISNANISIGSIFNNLSDGQIFLTNQYKPNSGITEGAISISVIDGQADQSIEESISAFGNPIMIDARTGINIGRGINSSAGSSEGADIILLSGGGITINSNAKNRALFSLSNESNAGNITLSAVGDITVESGDISSAFDNLGNPEVSGNGGDIEIISLNGIIQTENIGSGVLVDENNNLLGSGNSGNIRIISGAENPDGTITGGDIQVGTVNSRSNSPGDNAGNIVISAFAGSVSTRELLAENFSDKDDIETTDSGDISLTAFGDVTTSRIISRSFDGDSGNVSLESKDGEITIGFGFGTIDASSSSRLGDIDDAGEVSLIARGTIRAGLISSRSDGADAGEVTLLSREGDIFLDSSPIDIDDDQFFGSIATFSNTGSASPIMLDAPQGEIRTGNIRSSTGTAPQERIDQDRMDRLEMGLDELRGDVTLTADGRIQTRSIETTSENRNSGNIAIRSQSAGISAGFRVNDELFFGSDIESSSQSGNAGRIILEAGNIENGEVVRADDITFTEIQNIEVGNINSESAGVEDSGDITIRTERGGILTGNLIARNTSGKDRDAPTEGSFFTDAGSIELNAFGNVETTGTQILSSSVEGQSGSVTVISENGEISIGDNGVGSIISLVLRGEAGDIELRAEQDINVRDINSQSNTSDASEQISGLPTQAGNITIASTSGRVQLGSLSSSTIFNDRENPDESVSSGTVEINAPQQITVDSIRTSSIIGTSGSITVESTLGGITTFGELSSETDLGEAGFITLDAEGRLELSDVITSSGTNGSELISLSTNESLRLENVRIESETSATDAQGVGVEINAPALELVDATISATTIDGNAGDVFLNRDIAPATSLALRNNSRIIAQQTGDVSSARAGNVVINAQDIELKDGSSIETTNVASEVPESEQERFGNIVFNNLDTLTVNNSLISSSTQSGTAGSVTAIASDSIELGGTVDNDVTSRVGILAQATGVGGRAGNVSVAADRLVVEDGAQIAVSSERVGLAGVVLVEANFVEFDDKGRLSARTGSLSGEIEPAVRIEGLPGDSLPDGVNEISRGDIVVSLVGSEPIFWLRHESEINASAVNGASGGNVRIFTTADDGFIIAVPAENSDIVASAEGAGDGGGVFFGSDDFSARTFVLGLRERPERTFLSDVVVSSEDGASGLVGFSDPITEGFFELEEELLLPSSPNLDEGCQIGSRSRQAEFFDVGLGGAPPSPDELMGGGNILTEWIPLDLADSDSTAIIATDPTGSLIFDGVSFSRINLLSLCTADEE